MRRPGGVRRRPSALDAALGNPGHRAISHEPAAPRATQETLVPPDFLDERAIAELNFIAPLLANLRVLTDADVTALGAYCQTVSLYVQCQRLIRESGLVTPQGKSRDEVVIAAFFPVALAKRPSSCSKRVGSNTGRAPRRTVS